MSEAITAPAPTNAAPPATAEAASAPPDWRAALPEDIRAAPSLQKFADPGALAKSYTELEQLVGRKGLIVPTDKDGPEVHARYRAALGVPDAPEGYTLTAPEGLPEGVWSEDTAKGYAALAHKHGLTTAQAQGLAAEFVQMQTAAAVPPEEQQRQAEAELRKEWASDAVYARNLDAAKRAVGQFAPPEFKAFLEQSGLGNNPHMVRMLAAVGGAIAEDSPAGLNGANANRDPKTEAAELMAPGSPYWDALHPRHAATMARVKEIFAKTAA
jgi:hypothetical protein